MNESEFQNLISCDVTHSIIMLMVCMLLIYYFIRSNVVQVHPHPIDRFEGMSNGDLFEAEQVKLPDLTDKEYKFGPLYKGVYGDVPIYFNEDADNAYAAHWRKIHGGVYVPNAKLYWRKTVIPKEAAYWK